MSDMSRSRRKTPKFGIAGDSDKQDKRLANRKLRRAVRVALDHGDEVLPELREVSDVWSMSKDGKIYWPDGGDESMRK